VNNISAISNFKEVFSEMTRQELELTLEVLDEIRWVGVTPNKKSKANACRVFLPYLPK
jgi:hypothetical protein